MASQNEEIHVPSQNGNALNATGSKTMLKEVWSDAVVDSAEIDSTDGGMEPSNKKLKVKASEASYASVSVSNDEVVVSRTSPPISPDKTNKANRSPHELSPPISMSAASAASAASAEGRETSETSDSPNISHVEILPTTQNQQESPPTTTHPISKAHTTAYQREKNLPSEGLHEGTATPPPLRLRPSGTLSFNVLTNLNPRSSQQYKKRSGSTQRGCKTRYVLSIPALRLLKNRLHPLGMIFPELTKK